MLKIQNLSKKFGDKLAIHNINLEVKAGEVFCLIGPNGSGKTTLLKNIIGLLHPSTGTIHVEDIDAVAHPEKAKSVMGYIPDDPTGWSNVTGVEFLEIVAALYGVSAEQRRKDIPGLLSLFSLEPQAAEFFDEYSRGNKQKFTILAALLHKPKLLLIDEPIVGLDPASSHIAQQIFKDTAKKGAAVFMVTHTLTVAQNIADRIGFIKSGKLVEVGTLAELRAKCGLGESASLEDVYMKLVAAD